MQACRPCLPQPPCGPLFVHPIDPPPASDRAHLDRWHAGDKASGRELFRRHYDGISRFFRNKVKERDYEDLVQATFLGCLTNVSSFRGKSSFRTYLFGIAQNKLSNYYRTLASKHQGTIINLGSCSAVDLGIGPSRMIARRQEERLLLAALCRLSLQQQLVVELFYWEEMKAREIAEILEEPEPTIRRRLQRAREQLRRQLETSNAAPEIVESTISNFDQWKYRLKRRLPRPSSSETRRESKARRTDE